MKTVTYLRILLVVTLMWLTGARSQAQESVGDSIRVTLLTCSPGTKIYEIYGHTALRIQNFSKQYDAVFNYGVFSFEQPNFVLNFVLGKCDYCCEPIPYRYFIEEYVERGSSVTEQELNLTVDESNRLVDKLMWNIRPENKTYRYNFLLCNCTTRVRDVIESVVDGRVEYTPASQGETFRSILHTYTEGFDWYAVGNDILLGSSVDTIVTDRAAMFAPERMMAYADAAQIVDSEGVSRPMVNYKGFLLEKGQQVIEPVFPLSPLACSLIFVAILVAIMCVEIRIRRMLWGVDFVLMLAQGVAGLLIAFMFFFSKHPGVGSNWQIWVLNPLPLLCLPWVLMCAIKRRYCYFHIANLCGLIIFMIFYGLIPQVFCIIMLPLTIGLTTRPLSYLIYYRRAGISLMGKRRGAGDK